MSKRKKKCQGHSDFKFQVQSKVYMNMWFIGNRSQAKYNSYSYIYICTQQSSHKLIIISVIFTCLVGNCPFKCQSLSVEL